MANVDLTLSGILAGLRYVDQRKEELNIVALSMSWGGYFTEIPREWLRCDTNPELQQMAAVLSSLRKAELFLLPRRAIRQHWILPPHFSQAVCRMQWQLGQSIKLPKCPGM